MPIQIFGQKVRIKPRRDQEVQFLSNLTGVTHGVDDGNIVVLLDKPVHDPRYNREGSIYSFHSTSLIICE